MMFLAQKCPGSSPGGSAEIVFTSPYLDQISPLGLINKLVLSIQRDLAAPGQLRSVPYGITAPGQLRSVPYGRIDPQATVEIDFAGTEAAMSELAAQQGIDFDRLVDEAAEHFQDAAVRPRQVALTQEEIGSLTDDDGRAIAGL